MSGAERFLTRLRRSSEGLDPDADSFEPELAVVEYDDATMAEAWTETQWAAAAQDAEDDEDDEDDV